MKQKKQLTQQERLEHVKKFHVTNYLGHIRRGLTAERELENILDSHSESKKFVEYLFESLVLLEEKSV